MPPQTDRMKRLQDMLSEEPNDAELRYFLAMEYLSAGDEPTSIAKLRELTTDSTFVPAFLQAGQVLSRAGQAAEACVILRKGIDLAREQKNDHAQAEMQGLLDSIE